MPIERPIPRRIHSPSVRRIAGQMMRKNQKAVMDLLYNPKKIKEPRLETNIPARYRKQS